MKILIWLGRVLRPVFLKLHPKDKSGHAYPALPEPLQRMRGGSWPGRNKNMDQVIREQEKELESKNRERMEEKLTYARRNGHKEMCYGCDEVFRADELEVAESQGWISFGLYCKDCLSE